MIDRVLSALFGSLLFRISSRAARKRAQKRRRDREHLWPELWHRAQGNTTRFLTLATLHTAAHKHWRFTGEWSRGSDDPGVFAVHQKHRPRDRAFHPHCPLCRR